MPVLRFPTRRVIAVPLLGLTLGVGAIVANQPAVEWLGHLGLVPVANTSTYEAPQAGTAQCGALAPTDGESFGLVTPSGDRLCVAKVGSAPHVSIKYYVNDALIAGWSQTPCSAASAGAGVSGTSIPLPGNHFLTFGQAPGDTKQVSAKGRDGTPVSVGTFGVDNGREGHFVMVTSRPIDGSTLAADATSHPSVPTPTAECRPGGPGK